ncbi:hypothetical protein LTR10_013466 [Elasticomyces elasticus]|uniref:Plasmid pRiA4b Orf3-like domain-containing protein n=1 Tax=Exophiala sideris TaxID=1016849 RepID=A0ABR0JPU5_9EURO|nr:hypothetical protein LTR10_013466 [Elasticomyces elasticus]KAK5039601.1 hypothetical protein LTS07_000095 [Exophiala sideris]KAK5041153.1 hypothetical protein LTR13_002627 [Exophiala sideris]KAK5067978.1 hypothetical protein LTR69_000095 [Exophiala sideris]KAK5187280.1 hypothetical protein LTR44_000095 [Eurotiomycetes sp. CCFEE 6388]
MPKVSKARTSQRKDPLQGTHKSASTSKTNGASRPPTAEHPPNYLFHCLMIDSEDPMIQRMLSVPSTFTLEQMHEVLQVSFGWANSHLWQFKLHRIFSTEKEEEEDLGENGNMPLLTFVTDPEDRVSTHPWPEEDLKSASEWKLSDIFENDEYRSKVNLRYEYDFGDSWEHHITFLGIEDPGHRKALMPDAEYDIPVCFGGEGHPCAEDCGGAPGWEHLKEVLTKKSRDPELKDWYKRYCANGDPKGLDPYKWNIVKVNDRLAKLKA